MSLMAQVISIGVSVFFLCIVFELTRRERLKEKYALLWIIIGIVILLLAIFKKLVFFIASFMGIKTPIIAIIFIGIFFILLINLHFSLVVSNLSEQVKKVTQKLALLEFNLSNKKKESGSGK